MTNPSPRRAEALTAAGSALLPQAFPDGSLMRPSYGAEHAVAAAACVTVLKASLTRFDSTVISI